ncbi:pyridoxal phosphate-dependent decarboxylase family protein [Aquihabitans daechungensis]|uniref:pyridoxal phosphate-dependent decarboxylase family protein n=1 Tax=Aquihabitans daechungensis TaxID=1052257 RepID=UPI003BA19291
MTESARIPEHGSDAKELLARIEERHAADIDWRGGKAFSLVYNVDDHAHEDLIEQVALRYIHDNALNPFKYPSVLQMELEVISMACQLLGTEPDAGSMSSGGTESILLAVQVARDHARTVRGIAEPQLLTPSTAHPAFAKAAKYLDVEHILIPVGADGRADVAATEAAITERTGLIVGSAPCYPYGVIDDIPALAGLALERDILFHTDACLGGWILPWWERLGEDVPPWDFRVPGVTSISADIHKYGYTFKGASTVLYKSRELLQHQFFWYDDWPGGLYASGTAAGTRSAAPIAGAWAAINHLGEDGYLRLTEVVRDTTRRLQAGIEAIDGVRITHQPDVSLFEFGSDTHDIGAIGDVMDDKGWNLDRQQGGLHLMISPYHARIVDPFLADLAEAVATHGESRGKEASYGGLAT